jgi:hypothetical protein
LRQTAGVGTKFNLLAGNGSVFRRKSSALQAMMQAPLKIYPPGGTIMLFKNKSMLHTALLGNAIFCDLSGLVMILAAKPLASFLGLRNPTILIGIGIGLFAWAVLLFWGSLQLEVPRWIAWLAIDGDLAWVIGSVVVVLLPALSLSIAGKWTIAIIADVVLLFAIWHFFALPKTS